MTSFLITFKPASENPKRGWPLSELQKLVHRLNNGEPAEEAWRFKNRKDAKIGDRVFLLLQGKVGPTIIGYGRINGHPPKISGAPQIPVRFEGLVDPSAQAFATKEELLAIEGGERFWRESSRPHHAVLHKQRGGSHRASDMPQQSRVPNLFAVPIPGRPSRASINLKTATAIGLTVLPTLLARADEVIE